MYTRAGTREFRPRGKSNYLAVAIGTVVVLVAGCSGSGASDGDDGGGFVAEADPQKVVGVPLGSTGGGTMGDQVEPSCSDPTEVAGITTCADLEKAKAEGTVTFYSPDPEPKTIAVLKEFNASFPEIETKVVYLQTGALYARLQSERKAGAYQADVLIQTDLAAIQDFKEQEGWLNYVSPELAGFKQGEQISDPVGLWQNEGTMFGGIAYNADNVDPQDAPKTWKDLLNPKWKGKLNVKTSISGLQHLQWYTLGNLYGATYWEKFAKQEPVAFDSYVQQYDRLIRGEDLIVANAQYSGFVEYQDKGAPLRFIAPPDGMQAGPQAIGIPTHAPHLEAAKLLLDWYLSKPGQEVITRQLSLTSARADVAPPGDPADTDGSQLLFPAEVNDYIDSQTDFQRTWNALTGITP